MTLQATASQCRRALALRPATINEEERTIEAVISTGQRGLRYTWDGRYYESLQIDDKSVDLARANAGAPVLLDHDRYRVANNQIGVIERAWIDGGKIVAILRFSKRADVDPIWGDIVDGILRNLSIGYQPFKARKVSKENAKTPEYLITRFAIHEVSVVAVPFDSKAQFRSNDTQQHYNVEIERAMVMDEETTKAEADESAIASITPPPTQGDTNRQQQYEQASSEKERVATTENYLYIRKMAGKFGLSEEEEIELVGKAADREAVNEYIVSRQAQRSADTQVDGMSEPARREAPLERGQDEGQTRFDGVVNAILHRLDSSEQLTEVGRSYAGRSLTEITRTFLTDKGENCRDLMPSQLVKRAFTVSDDYALIFENVGKKTLVSSYEKLAVKQNWSSLVKFSNTNDYKEISRVRLGETPSFKKIEEHGEFERSKRGQAKETFQIYRWGRAFGITKEAIINDDLNAFEQMRNWGAAAARCETNLFWSIFTKPHRMGDNKPLFSKEHRNLHPKQMKLDGDALDEVWTAMGRHTGLDSEDPLAIVPHTLIVPSELRSDAKKLLMPYRHTPAVVDEKNIYENELNLIVSPHLSASSPVDFYFAADKDAGVQLIEMAHLNGVRAPDVEVDRDFGTRGISVSAEISLGAKALDWVGLYKVPGAK